MSVPAPASMESRRSDSLWAAGIVFASVVLQLLNRRPELSGPDAVVYLMHAKQSQALGFWNDPAAFGDNYWPMGYSTFLGLLDRLTPLTPLLVQGLQILLVAMTALLCWRMTRHVGRRTSLVVLAAVAFCPDMSWAGRTVAYEGLLAFLVTIAVWATWSGSTRTQSAQVVLGAVAGLALGCGALVSGRVLILVPVVGWLAFRRGWPMLISLAVAVSAPVLAWSVRNFLVTGASTPLSGNLKINLWIGNNPEATTGGYMAPPVAPSGYLRDSLDFFLDDPGAFLGLALRRQSRLLTPVFDEWTRGIFDPGGTISVGQAVIATLFVVTMVVGLLLWWAGVAWRGVRRVPRVAPAAAAATLYLLAAMPFMIEPRFRVPVTPLILVMAVPTLIMLGRQAWKRRRRREQLPKQVTAD